MVEMEEKIQQEDVTEEVVAEEPVTQQELSNLADLEKKRMAINADAEEHRRLRDDLNKQTKEWVIKRDTLNAQVRELVEEAGKHRKARDEYNQQVRDSKKSRGEANKLVKDLNEQLNKIKKEMPPRDKDQPSIRQLKKEFSDLENEQMTNATLSKSKEEAIVKKLRELDIQIKEIEKTSGMSSDIRAIFAQLREAKNQAENWHKLVSEAAEKAQTEHDVMIELYEQADKLRKQADEAQAKFIECKKAADEEHKKHIEQIKSYHETDSAVAAIKNKQKSVRKKKSDVESKKASDIIFMRFKNGEKLSTEDLMALQKSGYL